MAIRTRFAPSPTGYLHIGGVRTALFNWLLAKNSGGQFILRIDDTDADRNRPEALQPILDGFRWLGMTWDEGPEIGGPYAPYFQGQRKDRYHQVAMQLLASGHAFPDYLTKDQLDAERKQAEIAKRAYVHRGPHRDTPAAECVRLYQEKPTTLRFKVPLGQTSVVDDLICGKVEQKTDLLGDFVIARADGGALYNFASAIDDIDFQITHVIRAREHLPNTHLQQMIFKALGAPLPRFGHVPVVNEPNSSKKLSKRDMKKFVTEEVRANLNLIGWTDEQIDARDDLNPATVAFYREMGYLPEGVINYLCRLGWSLDDKTEFFTVADLIKAFNMEVGIGRVNDSPARFDPSKMYWVNGEHMQKLSLDEKIAGCIPYLVKAKLISEPVTPEAREIIAKIITASADRIKLFSDILPYGRPIFAANPEYAPKAVEKRLKKPGAMENLLAFKEILATLDPFDAPTIDKALHQFCESKTLKLGEMVAPIRVAVTGVEMGFGLFDTLAVLGKAEVLRRIDLASQLK